MKSTGFERQGSACHEVGRLIERLHVQCSVLPSHKVDKRHFMSVVIFAFFLFYFIFEFFFCGLKRASKIGPGSPDCS